VSISMRTWVVWRGKNKIPNTHTHTHIHTHRDTHTQRERETGIERETLINTPTHTHTDTRTHRNSHTYRNRQTLTHRSIQADPRSRTYRPLSTVQRTLRNAPDTEHEDEEDGAHADGPVAVHGAGAFLTGGRPRDWG